MMDKNAIYSLFGVMDYKGGELRDWTNCKFDYIIQKYFEPYLEHIEDCLENGMPPIKVKDYGSVHELLLRLKNDERVYGYYAGHTGMSDPIVYEHKNGLLVRVEPDDLFVEGAEWITEVLKEK